MEDLKQPTLEEIVNQIKSEVSKDFSNDVKENVDKLKQTFYAIYNGKKRENDETATEDMYDWEKELKEQLTIWSAKRKQHLEETERVYKQNENTREKLIKQVEDAAASAESVHEHINEVREIQTKWKETGEVSPTKKSELQSRFTKAVETFYDTLKMNLELRDYDFAKNLKIKTDLCERAERLTEEPNVITAYKGVTNLQEEWRATGPVAKEKRAEIWLRFKEAVTVINKRHNDFFAAKKEEEKESLASKQRIVEEIEKVVAHLNQNDSEKPLKQKDWKNATEKIIELQKQWKETIAVTSKEGKTLMSQYRNLCDEFFEKKSAFFKSTFETEQENKNKKQALIDEAKEIYHQFTSSSETDEKINWRAASNRMKQLQTEWKNIGSVPRKVNDAMWHEFTKAMNGFFNALKEHHAKEDARHKAEIESKNQIERKTRAPKEKLAKIENDIKVLENNMLFLRPQKGGKPNPLLKNLESQLEKLKAEQVKLQTEIVKQQSQASE